MPRPHALRHALNDQTQSGIAGRALGLSQQTGRGAIPSARHRAQNGGQLIGDGLREGVVDLFLVDDAGLGRSLGGVKRFFVQAHDFNGKRPDESQIELVGSGMAQRLRQPAVRGVVHADVQHRVRPAPVRRLARRADGQQHRLAFEQADQGGKVGHLPFGDFTDGGEGDGNGLRHRQVHANKALQAARPECRRWA